MSRSIFLVSIFVTLIGLNAAHAASSDAYNKTVTMSWSTSGMATSEDGQQRSYSNLNTRTVYMNPVSRFIYWNMNYHVEHHMFPMVPYHALPKLHEMIKHDLPEPNPSIWHAYREVWPVLLRQLRNEDCFLKRELPPTAKPYREEFHAVNMASAAAE